MFIAMPALPAACNATFKRRFARIDALRLFHIVDCGHAATAHIIDRSKLENESDGRVRF